ncbi:MAG: hypothetical protein U0271_02835 [Polyangiaceae bacterium]
MKLFVLATIVLQATGGCSAPPRNVPSGDSSAPATVASSAYASVTDAPATTTLATFPGRLITEVAVDGTDVYFVTRDVHYVDEPFTFDVRRVSTTGGPVTIVADRLSPNGFEPPHLAAGGGAVYFTGANNAVQRQGRSGEPVEVATVYGVAAIEFIDSTLWMLGTLEVGGERSLLAVDSRGGAPRIVSHGDAYNVLSKELAFDVSSKEAFVWRRSNRGEELVALVDDHERIGPHEPDGVAGLRLAGAELYWWSWRDKALVEADLKTLTPTKRAETGLPLCSDRSAVVVSDAERKQTTVIAERGRSFQIEMSGTACALSDALYMAEGNPSEAKLLRVPPAYR